MIYSIGHGSKTINEFLDELRSFQIAYLIDVRTKPYSKYNPQFNQESLKSDLEHAGLTYVFMGDNLGGLPKDRSCYTNGKVDYELVREKTFFKEGLKRLKNANTKGINVAIMCSESKPEECHRSKLIGLELGKLNIPVLHIVSPTRTKSQVEVMNELNKGKNLTDLFNQQQSFTSRKKYE
jgi:uncharacterized protein (DUF488 family)